MAVPLSMIAQLQPLTNYDALPSFIQSAEQTKADNHGASLG
jgi:hypothetical protein